MKAAEELGKSKTYEFGEYHLEAASLSLFREKQIVQLPPKTIEVLLALVESGGRVVTRDEITERVWAETFVEEANLTNHVSALRKTLGEDGDERKFIETIPRRGYRFVAEVREIATVGATEMTISERTMTRVVEEEIEIADAPQLIEDVVAPPIALETPALPKASEQRFRRRWRSLVLAGIISFVALAGVAFAFYKFNNSAPMRFEAKNITRITSTGKIKLAVISPDGKFIIYTQEENNEQQSLWMRHIGSESHIRIAAPANSEYRSLNISPDGNSIYYVNEQFTLYQMPVLGNAAKKVMEKVSGGFAFSPDGKQIAFVRSFGNDASSLFTANIDGTNERMLASFERPIVLKTFPTWSPDGKIIACGFVSVGIQNVLAVQVADETSAPVLPQDWHEVKPMAWLPDSKSLLIIGRKADRTSYSRQIWQISYPGGEARQITNDTNNYDTIALTSDGRFLTTVRNELVAHIWTMPSDDVTRARQLTRGFEKSDGVSGLSWMPDGKIVYGSSLSGNGIISLMEADGSNSKQLIKGSAIPTVSPDGRYLVSQKGTTAASDRGLWRWDLSDGSEKQLTKGTDIWATFSPDSKWIIYTHYGERVGLWKVSVEGGETKQILDGYGYAICPTVSPDGKTVAFVLSRTGQTRQIALLPFDGGEIIKTFDATLQSNPTNDKKNLQWTADGRGIYFIAFTNGVSNIWQQPIDGSAPVQVTNFKEGRIFNFAFSADGSQLALSRGTFNSDVVLIENQK